MLGNIVNQYLTCRLTLSHHALLNEAAAFSSSHEIIEYQRMISSTTSEAAEPGASSTQHYDHPVPLTAEWSYTSLRTTNHMSILHLVTPSVGVSLGVQAPSSGFKSL
jgi:hypothetical protein